MNPWCGKKKRLAVYVFWCCVHWHRHDQAGNVVRP
jgi:hypothetical protein